MSNPTMKDIAKKAGVTRPCVSMILNSRPYSVKQETREKVLRIAREMNYQPNLLAQSLKTGKTNTVGISSGLDLKFSDLMLQTYMTQLCAGFGDVVGQKGFKIIFNFINQNTTTGDTSSAVELARSRTIDGLFFILIYDYLTQFNETQLPLLRSLKVPFVVAHSLPGQALPFPNVGVNCCKGGYAAGEHLIQHGYVKQSDLGFVFRKNPVPLERELWEGFRTALNDYHISNNKLQVFYSDGSYGDHGYQLADTMLRNKVDIPRAFFTTSDAVALGMTERFGEARTSVPDDVALISFNGFLDPLNVPHKLTIVKHPVFEKGQQCGEMLLELMEDPEKLDQPQSIRLETELVVRRSCGCT